MEHELKRFVEQNVDRTRGGYRPEEVAELIRRAWRAGRKEYKDLQIDTMMNRPLGWDDEEDGA